MRHWIGALCLAAVAVSCAACSGGSAASAEPSGAAAASQVPAVCINVVSLRSTVEALISIKPETAGAVAIRMAANNVATQTATFVSAAPADLRQDAEGLKTAVEAVRSAAGKTGSGTADLQAAIAGMDAAWKAFEAKLAATCPN